jgi:SSS family solute:Na+ symporter
MGSVGFVVSFLAVLVSTVIAGVAAKRSVRTSSDFTNASGKLRSGMVAGALVGGFVGGTSIVGTGELAFQHGLAALWFTLGGGLAVILLGLFAHRFLQLKVETLPELIGTQYGERAQLGASLFLSLGMFIQVIAQLLAALPFVSVFWRAELHWLAVVPALLIFAYVLAGGFMGASVVGSLKTVMLALLLVCTGVWLGWHGNGETYLRWWTEGRFSLLAPKANLGWAQGGAMVIGIFSTQAYLQPIFASLNAREARKGSIAAGVAIILIGLVSAWIGLYMHDAHPEILPREAIPQFFLRYAPVWFSGAAYAVILLSVVMTGAALTLSITTILNRDVIQRYSRRFHSENGELAVSRVLIISVIAIGYAMVCLDSNALILKWAFLAMTLRGVTVFLPVMFYLLRFGRIDHRWALLSVWGAPLTALVWTWVGMPLTGIDPLYVSGLWSLCALCLGKWTAKTPSLRPMG